MSHSTADLECTTIAKAHMICSFCQHSPSLKETFRRRGLLLPEPRSTIIRLESHKGGKYPQEHQHRRFHRSAPNPRRRRAFAPVRIRSPRWPIGTPPQPCYGPAPRQTETPNWRRLVNPGQPPTLMTDEDIVITSFRLSPHHPLYLWLEMRSSRRI
jgi:hypothetical protein